MCSCARARFRRQKQLSTHNSVHRESEAARRLSQLPPSPSRSCYLLSPLVYLVVLRTFTPRKRNYSRYIFVMSHLVMLVAVSNKANTFPHPLCRSGKQRRYRASENTSYHDRPHSDGAVELPVAGYRRARTAWISAVARRQASKSAEGVRQRHGVDGGGRETARHGGRSTIEGRSGHHRQCEASGAGLGS